MFSKEYKRKAFQEHVESSWRIAQGYEKFFQDVIKENNLTNSQKDILLFLYNNPHINTASDIVKRRSISKSMVSKSVDMLICQGLLESKQCKKDGRLKKLELTEKSKPVLKKLIDVQQDFLNTMFKDFSKQEFESLKKTNEKIKANLMEDEIINEQSEKDE